MGQAKFSCHSMVVQETAFVFAGAPVSWDSTDSLIVGSDS